MWEVMHPHQPQNVFKQFYAGNCKHARECAPSCGALRGTDTPLRVELGVGASAAFLGLHNPSFRCLCVRAARVGVTLC